MLHVPKFLRANQEPTSRAYSASLTAMPRLSDARLSAEGEEESVVSAPPSPFATLAAKQGRTKSFATFSRDDFAFDDSAAAASSDKGSPAGAGGGLGAARPMLLSPRSMPSKSSLRTHSRRPIGEEYDDDDPLGLFPQGGGGGAKGGMPSRLGIPRGAGPGGESGGGGGGRFDKLAIMEMLSYRPASEAPKQRPRQTLVEKLAGEIEGVQARGALCLTWRTVCPVTLDCHSFLVMHLVPDLMSPYHSYWFKHPQTNTL